MGLAEINRARIEQHDEEIQQLNLDVATLQGDIDAIDPIVTDESFPNIKPPTPVNVVANGLFRNIQVMWSFNSATYIAGYEVYASQNAGFTPMQSDLIWKGKDSGFNFEASTDQTWYFRVRSFNTHGTFSDFSEEAIGKTVYIEGIDIDSLYQEQTVEYANQYTAEREAVIMGEVADKLDAQVYHDNIVLKADKATVQDEIDAINTEMGNKADSAQVQADLALREFNIHRNITAPTGTNQLWLDTSVSPNILKRHDGTSWVKASPTEAGEVGAYTKTEVDTALNAKASKSEFDTLTGRVTNAETSITQNATDIALRATKTEVGTLTGRVDTAETSITTNANEIALRATKTEVNTLAGRVANTETSITANASEIALRATKTEVNTLSDRVSTAESSITTNANNIALRVTKATYDADINDATNGLIARMNSAESSITANAGQIALKASQTELDTRMGDVVDRLDTAEASITVNANAISQRVTTTTFNALAGRVTTAESSITTNANNIALKASQSDLNALDGRLDTAESTITLHSGQISSKVEKNGVISSINQTAESIKIDVAKMTINGDLEVLSGVTRLKALTVGTAHIKDDAIIGRMIANGVITNTMIASNASIDFAKIGNVVITNAMIQNLTADKVTAGTFHIDRIPTLTSSKINVTSLSQLSGDIGSVSSTASASDYVTIGGGKISTYYKASGASDSYRAELSQSEWAMKYYSTAGVNTRTTTLSQYGLTIDDSILGTLALDSLKGGLYASGNMKIDAPTISTTGKMGIGTSANSSYGLTVAGDIYNTGWIRSSGTTGLYLQSYGGGIHMQDTTWVRVYGSKAFLVNNTIQANYVNSTGNVNASGTVSGASVTSSGGISASGDVSGSSITTSGTVSGGYISSSGDIRANGAGVVYGNNVEASFEIRGRSAEFRWNGGTPYIDFSNASTDDYDVRLILSDNDKLSVTGGNLAATIVSPSLEELKYDIEDFNVSALSLIKKAKPKRYAYKERKIKEMKVGIMAHEAPAEVLTRNGDAVDNYSMITLAWKAIQELSDEITLLKEKVTQTA